MRFKPLIIPAALLIIILGFVYYLNRNQPLELPSPSLKELASQKGLQIGNFAILSHLNEWQYDQILSNQFHFVTADNVPNWYFTGGGMRPSPTEFNFLEVDQVFAYAEARGMPVQAHHYVWGEEKWLPDWLKNGNYNKQQLHDLMRDHILTVGNHYRGRVREWTVVNEAFSRNRDQNGLRDWWADHTGDMDYVSEAFRWARQADPNVILILNDFGNEGMNEVSNAMYTYIKKAKSEDVPIDALGMQMHIDGTHPPTKDEVIKNMQRFGDLGVKVYVTEFDVNMNDVKAPPDDKDKIQADIYYDMLRACIESTVCPSFALLGITDKETWYNHIGLPDPRPLPFDKDYQPKPAFFSMRDALML